MRLIIDITTLIDSEVPHGISRLIGEVTRALSTTDGAAPVLVRYADTRQSFEVLSLDVSRALAVRGGQPGGLQMWTPPVTLPPWNADNHRLVERLYYVLPVPLRLAAMRAFNAMDELGREMMTSLFLRQDPLKAIGGRVTGPYEPLPGDLFLQAGALWMHRGVGRSLRELRAGGVRIVSLICDVIPLLYPHFFEAKFAQRFTAWFVSTISESSQLIAISATTQRDIEAEARRRQLDCPPLVTLTLGDDSFAVPAQPASPSLRLFEDRDFALCLGTLEVRKNAYLLYRVWRRMIEAGVTPPRLVLVGQRGWLANDVYQLLTNDPLLHDHVYVMHGANDSDVAWLLDHAALVLYPSFYEGWGLPVAEALAAGRAVLASTSPAVVEAGQGLAIHLDVDDVAAWQQAILSLTEDATARRAVEARVRREYRPTGWRETAVALAALLDAVPPAERRAASSQR